MGHTHRSGRINRSTFAIFIAAIAVLTLTLAGCGSNTAKSSGDPNTLTVAISSAVSTLSVNQEAGSANYQLAALYQEGLTGVDGTGKVSRRLPRPGSPATTSRGCSRCART